MVFEPDYFPCERCKPLFDGLTSTCIEELETQLEERNTVVDAFNGHARRLEADLATAREALEFYADESNWESDENLSLVYTLKTDWGENSWDIARHALDKLGGDE